MEKERENICRSLIVYTDFGLFFVYLESNIVECCPTEFDGCIPCIGYHRTMALNRIYAREWRRLERLSWLLYLLLKQPIMPPKSQKRM